MKIVFLLSHIPNPRMYKRIHALCKLGDISIICIRRLNQDIFSVNEENDIPHFVFDLDLPLSSHLFKRYRIIRLFKKYAIKKLNDLSPDIIYTAGMDMLLIVDEYFKRHSTKVVYEVADLRECFIKSSNKSFYRKMLDAIICRFEKNLFTCVSLLIVTSIKFYYEHYSDFFPSEKILEIPNMPNLQFFSSFIRKRRNSDFVIGFIGAIRYVNQLKMLVDVAGELNVKVFFAGLGSVDDQFELERYCSGKNWVEIFGKYEYEKDIANLYGKADCIYSVYNADNPNVRIALPNKFYEAIYCELPIIVAKNTYLSELVLNSGVGIAVLHTDNFELKDAILKLKNNIDFYNNLVEHCREYKKTINSEIYMRDLSSAICKLQE